MKGIEMTWKKIIIGNLVTFAVITIPSTVWYYRFKKKLADSYAKMDIPLPPIREEYLRQHRNDFIGPDGKSNDIIDRFIDHPEQFNL